MVTLAFSNMSYQVIARKYRPQRFADVVGQEHVTTTLSNAIASGRIAHAYLFAGPRGTGKTTIARIFAKCLNATDGPMVDFKDDDERCAEIAGGCSLDVLEIDGASNRGIDQIRELRDTVNYAPASSRYKVYIIDEVHMLTKEAFNALLKTLEEPPEHVKFMFATTEPEQVLATILSRCQRFDLRRIPAALIVEHLTGIAKKEKVKIDEAALNAIARGADGGMRDAESTLDQLISFCGEKIEERDVLSMFGLSSQNQIISLSTAILEGESRSVLTEFNSLVDTGKELPRLVGDLLNHFRNLMVFQLSKGDLSLLEISEAESDALSAQSKLVDSSAVSRVLEVITHCEIQLRNAASKRILLEVSLMKAVDAVQAMSLNNILDELQRLRGELPEHEIANDKKVSAISKGKSVGGANKPTTKHKGSQKTQQEAVEEKAEIPVNTDLKELWAKMMESLGVFSRAYFQEAFLNSYEDGIVSIGFPEEFAPQMELADTRDINRALIDALSDSGREVRSIKYAVAERPKDWVPLSVGQTGSGTESNADSASTKIPEGPVDMEEFKNDPLIKKALDVFKGKIVDVRT